MHAAHYALLLGMALVVATPCLADDTGPAGPEYSRSYRHSEETSQANHSRAAWKRFPLSVYFVPNENDTPTREATALRGFDHWNEATGGVVRYEVTDRRSQAQIVVRFDPTTSDGRTTVRMRGDVMERADMNLGVKQLSRFDQEYTAAHEFGHALGLHAHSNDRGDLMYPYHWTGKPMRITEADLNRLVALYPKIVRRRETTTSVVESARASVYPDRPEFYPSRPDRYPTRPSDDSPYPPYPSPSTRGGYRVREDGR